MRVEPCVLARRASVRHAFADSRYRLPLHWGAREPNKSLVTVINFHPLGNPTLNPRPGDNADGLKISWGGTGKYLPINGKKPEQVNMHLLESSRRAEQVHMHLLEISRRAEQVNIHLYRQKKERNRSIFTY